MLVFSSLPSYGGSTLRKVMITPSIDAVSINHHGIPITVERIQNTHNRLADDFTKTSRPCPPFCIHPISAAKGVLTIGELELLDFLIQEVADETGLLIDARMPNWYKSETIPGSVNAPFVIFTKASVKRERMLKLLGVTIDETGKKDFSNVIKLTLFCNGPWCDQSPRAIKGLLSAGYPPEKIQYYRGGMQAWKSFGLTTVLPENNEVGK
ncbi:MAG: sulfurtransferase [Thiotrichaceae bacterium]|nr:MAG: sulfurtransferase [Thiotrichaceae bacterium]